MAYIKVDHNKLENAAAAIEQYIQSSDGKMKAAATEINTLSADWQGEDFNSFKARWDTVTDDSSAYRKMTVSLECYAEFLRFAKKQYQEAQAKAIDMAKSLF